MKALKLFWWKETTKGGLQNFGDLLSPYIIEKLSGLETEHVKPSDFLYKYYKKHIISIGSIIGYANKNSIIWGSGIIQKDQNVKGGKFLAVRGPQTRKRLLELGFNNVAESYGDPALLLPLLYNNDSKIKYEIGVVPHYVDFDDLNKKFQNQPSIKVINLLTLNPEDIVDQIRSCKYIIATSLHGIIVSHAYNIPALWIKYSNKLFGDDIKFTDYYESIGFQQTPKFKLPKPVTLSSLIALVENNMNLALPDKNKIEELQKNLINSFFTQIKYPIKFKE